jgi:hypothetical protein
MKVWWFNDMKLWFLEIIPALFTNHHSHSTFSRLHFTFPVLTLHICSVISTILSVAFDNKHQKDHEFRKSQNCFKSLVPVKCTPSK